MVIARRTMVIALDDMGPGFESVIYQNHKYIYNELHLFYQINLRDNIEIVCACAYEPSMSLYLLLLPHGMMEC